MGRKFYFIVSMRIILYCIFTLTKHQFRGTMSFFKKKLCTFLSNLTRGLDISTLLKWNVPRLVTSGLIYRQTASARVDTDVSASRATASSLIVRMLVWLWSSSPLSPILILNKPNIVAPPIPAPPRHPPSTSRSMRNTCPHPSVRLVAPSGSLLRRHR